MAAGRGAAFLSQRAEQTPNRKRKTLSDKGVEMTMIARTAGFAAALAAPALIFLGAATADAESSVSNFGPSVTHHDTFPHQDHVPTPGTTEHHHHQYNRGR